METLIYFQYIVDNIDITIALSIPVIYTIRYFVSMVYRFHKVSVLSNNPSIRNIYIDKSNTIKIEKYDKIKL